MHMIEYMPLKVQNYMYRMVARVYVYVYSIVKEYTHLQKEELDDQETG